MVTPRSMATTTVVAMPTSLPMWKRYPQFFRGMDRVLNEIARKVEMERRLANTPARPTTTGLRLIGRYRLSHDDSIRHGERR